MTAFSHTRSRSNSVTSLSFISSFDMLKGLSHNQMKTPGYFWENPYCIGNEDKREANELH
jgi:hypothetical protein